MKTALPHTDLRREKITNGGIARCRRYLSSRITLHPGDVILTGTPAGVGAETGERLAKGDVVRIEIGSIGTLTTNIV